MPDLVLSVSMPRSVSCILLMSSLPSDDVAIIHPRRHLDCRDNEYVCVIFAVRLLSLATLGRYRNHGGPSNLSYQHRDVNIGKDVNSWTIYSSHSYHPQQSPLLASRVYVITSESVVELQLD